jgi:enamine deaminase RidA (YjgF/YER057c/UK114 family)
MGAEERLAELGIELPEVPAAKGNYVGAVRTGNLVFLSGSGPWVGEEIVQGKVDAEISVEEAQRAARMTGLNLLAVLRAEIGSLDRVVRVVKGLGMVACSPGFNRMPEVVNGFSDLMVEVFGEAGRHARAAVGVAELPFDVPVEIDLVVEVE